MVAAYDSNVGVIIEAAFGSDPLATPSWTEITSFVRQFSTQRGRNRVLDDMQAGVATIVLDNTDFRFDPNDTGSPYTPDVRVFTPIRIRGVHNVVTYDLFYGFATGWPQTYPGFKDSVVVLECVDAFRLMAMFEEELTESQEASGTRIGNLLDTMGWPAGLRDLDTGNHNVAAITAEFNSVRGEISQAVLVEQGLFWIAGDGDATFRDGNTRIEDDSIQATFSDDGSDLAYSDIHVDYDDTQLWNKAVVTRTDGTAQTASDATSIGDFGERDLHLSGTAHTADGEANALAEWLVDDNKDIRTRVSVLTVKPGQDPANLWPAALGLELWEKVNVERNPTGADTLDVDCYIEGVAHTVTMVGGRKWTTTLQLSPDLGHSDWWILGTSELDTETRLGY